MNRLTCRIVETVGGIIPIEGEPNKYLLAHGAKLTILTWNGKYGGATVQNIRAPDPTRPYPYFYIDEMKVAPNGAVFFFYIPFIYNQDITTVPPNQCTLYDINNRKQKELVDDLQLGFGLGFSKDGRYFFYNDGGRNHTYKAYYNQQKNSMSK